MRTDVLEHFHNDDAALREKIAAVVAARRAAGLEGLTGGLEAVVVNVERDRFEAAVRELLRYTGLDCAGFFEDAVSRTCVLRAHGSADFLVRCRRAGTNPFAAFNANPKSGHLPDTRLESFIFKCPDVRRYAEIQRGRGVAFQGGVVETDAYLYIQTPPSAYTGNALGFVQWKGPEGRWEHGGCRPLPLAFAKPDLPHLKNIRWLDHTATRVKAEERDAAILEFMSLTSYDFDFAVYVESLNSITNVARLTRDDYAQVFTSGIEPFRGVESSGPTEKFIYNYGKRVHHVAFQTEEIDATYAALKADGLEFLVELVGSPEEGLKQTFSQTSPTTLLVTEYIYRYGDFDGFFTRSNVTALTAATDKQ